MATRLQKRDTGIGISLVASAVIHVAVFLLLYWWGDLFPHTVIIETTYYVDVVNLPVASSRSGTPEGRPESAEPAPPPPPAPEKAMTLPTPPRKSPAAKQQAQKQVVKPGPSEDEQAFARRMEKLRNVAESRQEEEAIARLRTKVSQTPGRQGMPGGTGTQSGSDYVAYIQSRLKDAFRETISYDTKAPEMSVRLYIDQEGRLTRRKVERSSGDRAFELAVYRAIDLATAKLPPPPDHKNFDRSFLFRPQGITNHKP